MSHSRKFGARRFGLGAAAALVMGLGSAGSAGIAGAASSVPGAAPAASVTGSVANNVLTIKGTSGADLIALNHDPANAATLVLDIGADGSPEQSFDSATFTSISVFLGAGDDQFTQQRGLVDAPTMVNGGAGHDVISTGAGNDVVLGGTGNDTISTDIGEDLILGGNGNDTVIGGRDRDAAFLGSGTDSFVWNPGDGSDPVDGQSGTDTLVFNGSNAGEIMSLAPNGPAAIFLRDVANIRMDLTHVEALDLHALAGADNVSVGDMSGTSFRKAYVDLSATSGLGDGEADQINVTGTQGDDHINVAAEAALVDVSGLKTETRITGGENVDKLQVNTLDGDDQVAVHRAGPAVMGVAVNLGAALA